MIAKAEIGVEEISLSRTAWMTRGVGEDVSNAANGDGASVHRNAVQPLR